MKIFSQVQDGFRNMKQNTDEFIFINISLTFLKVSISIKLISYLTRNPSRSIERVESVRNYHNNFTRLYGNKIQCLQTTQTKL